MGIFDPSFPEIRDINEERRQAIKDLATKQISATPEPFLAVNGDDLLIAIDAETGAEYPIQISSVQGDLSGFVSSDDITTIVKLTQVEYDAIGTPDEATLYVIVG
jgi:hypothetical protein